MQWGTTLLATAAAATLPGDAQQAVPWLSVAWILVRLAITLGAALGVWTAAYWVLKFILRKIQANFALQLLRASRVSIGIILPAAALLFELPAEKALPEGLQKLLYHGIALVLILACTKLGLALTRACAEYVRDRHKIDIGDNYSARVVHTQIAVLQRVAQVILIIIGIGVALMTFNQVRQFGASLLASAGLAGLVMGFAARPVLENIIAGIQIAMARPINIDDVVIISGEWGRIEEITTTYVVVHIWDDRRLIVPFSKFISEPFQNWTRRSAELMGTVYLYTDYTAPINEIRQALCDFCEECPEWDHRVCNLQVTDADQHALQLRALVSAKDSSLLWTLRVKVREALIEYLQAHHPESLPRTRVKLQDREEDKSAGAGSST